MSLIPVFPADYPGAIVFPCDASNCYNPAGHGGVPNDPRAFILHTPEEPADGFPATPHWFAQYHPNQAGSTIYFVAYNGDVYQCLPESWAAIANGLNGKPRPSWALPGSLNWQTLNVEVEGYAGTIQDTLQVGGKQWNSLVKLIKHRCAHHKIPLDSAHIMGHYQLSIDRTDPGAKFPWNALMAALQEDDMTIQVVSCADAPGGFQNWALGSGNPRLIGSAAEVSELVKLFGAAKPISWASLKTLGAGT